MTTLIHNPDKYETRVNGQEVFLTKTEFKLLSVLSDGNVHSRPALLAAVWGADPTNKTRTVDMHMSRLKTKLGEAGKLIKTLHGVGYKLIEG